MMHSQIRGAHEMNVEFCFEASERHNSTNVCPFFQSIDDPRSSTSGSKTNELIISAVVMMTILIDEMNVK